MERQMPDIDPGFPRDPGPGDDPQIMPRFPTQKPQQQEAREDSESDEPSKRLPPD
jgi:hypothetical protein